MPIYMSAQWKCRPGSEAKVQAALRRFVASVAENEPGTRLYTALQSVEDATSFMTYFIFEDGAARDFHRATQWVERFTEAIYPENLEPVAFTEHRLIASTEGETSGS